MIIKTRRRRLGLRTQEGLARKTGLSVSVIGLAERGYKVDDQTLMSIEYALRWPAHATLEYLRTGDEALVPVDVQAEPAAPTPRAPTVRERREQLAQRMAQLIEEMRSIQEEIARLPDEDERRAQ